MRDKQNKKTLYLHIGMHKTGTTALQTFFSLNEKALAARGICYPDVGRSKTSVAHHDIANSIKGPPFPLKEPAKSADEYICDLRDCFSSFPTIVLSSEIFMRFVPAFGDHLGLNLSALDALESTVDVVKIIIYLRRQDDYLESFYSQEVKHKLCMTFPEFVAAKMPHYFEICSELVDRFGSDNVLIRVYDRENFLGGSIFSDFLSVFNLELTHDFVVPTEPIHPSISADEREFKLLVNTLQLSIRDVMRFNAPLMVRSQIGRKENHGSEPGFSLFSAIERKRLIHDCALCNHKVATKFIQRDAADDALFPGFNNSTDSCKPLYPGLSDKALEDILKYIKSNSPELITLLNEGIEKSLNSKDSTSIKSATLLRAAL